jgi:hypothetical protein
MCMQRPSFGFTITNAYTKPIMISQHRWLSKPYFEHQLKKGGLQDFEGPNIIIMGF